MGLADTEGSNRAGAILVVPLTTNLDRALLAGTAMLTSRIRALTESEIAELELATEEALGRVDPESVLELVSRGIVRSDFRVASEVDSIRVLMRKFSDVPMSLADACLVRMTELDQQSVVLTLDSDFRIYRRNRRQVVPTISPGKGGR